jgi:hypothetical protein
MKGVMGVATRGFRGGVLFAGTIVRRFDGISFQVDEFLS